MKKALNLKVMGMALDNSAIFIDGKEINLKRNEFGNLTYTETFDKDSFRIQIVRYVDVGGFFWFIFQLLLHLITIFGLFDFWKVKYMSRIDFVADVDLLDGVNELKLTYNGITRRRKNRRKKAVESADNQQDDRAFLIETEMPVTTLSNALVSVEKEENTLMKLKKAKKWLTVCTIVAIAVAIIVVLTI